MFRTMRRMHREERGFTLVELLIVVTILGILAAVVTTSLIGLTSTAKTNACAEELRTVQTAMDAMMAQNNISTVTAQAAATNTWTALPVGAGTTPLSPNFIRQANNVAVKAVTNGVTYTTWSGTIGWTTVRYGQRVASQNTTNPGVGPWTQAVINGLTARFGFSSDASPVPYLDGIILEYAWQPVVATPATITIAGAAGGSTVNTTYSDAGAAAPTLSTWTATK